MKRILLICLFSSMAFSGFSQDMTQPAPYLKFKSFPPVKLLLPDSVSYFTKDDLPKKKPVMLMLFNPGCDHCRHETEEIIRNMDKFSDIQILMVTSQPFDSMQVFREKYQLAQYPNITVTRDENFFLITYFNINSLPFLAFFNRKKELISVFQGTMPIEKALEELKK